MRAPGRPQSRRARARQELDRLSTDPHGMLRKPLVFLVCLNLHRLYRGMIALDPHRNPMVAGLSAWEASLGLDSIRLLYHLIPRGRSLSSPHPLR